MLKGQGFWVWGLKCSAIKWFRDLSISAFLGEWGKADSGGLPPGYHGLFEVISCKEQVEGFRLVPPVLSPEFGILLGDPRELKGYSTAILGKPFRGTTLSVEPWNP